PMPALAQGELDLLIGPSTVPGDDALHRRELWGDEFVVVMRRGHPLTRGPLTLERFVAAQHALIAPGGRPGGVVDDALEKLGLRRRVAFATANFLVMPQLVAKTDLVLT